MQVNYVTRSGTAAPDQRYRDVAGLLVFRPGDVSKTFSVPLIDGVAYEGNQTAELSLSNLVGGSLARGNVTLVLVDNETANGVAANMPAGGLMNVAYRLALADLSVAPTSSAARPRASRPS